MKKIYVCLVILFLIFTIFISRAETPIIGGAQAISYTVFKNCLDKSEIFSAELYSELDELIKSYEEDK